MPAASPSTAQSTLGSEAHFIERNNPQSVTCGIGQFLRYLVRTVFHRFSRSSTVDAESDVYSMATHYSRPVTPLAFEDLSRGGSSNSSTSLRETMLPLSIHASSASHTAIPSNDRNPASIQPMLAQSSPLEDWQHHSVSRPARPISKPRTPKVFQRGGLGNSEGRGHPAFRLRTNNGRSGTTHKSPHAQKSRAEPNAHAEREAAASVQGLQTSDYSFARISVYSSCHKL